MPLLRAEGETLRVAPNFAAKHRNLLLGLGITFIVVGSVLVLYGWAHFTVNSMDALESIAGYDEKEIEMGKAYEDLQISLKEMVKSQPFVYLGVLLALVGLFLALFGLYGRTLAQIDDELLYYKVGPRI
jgi:hypothetical protein